MSRRLFDHPLLPCSLALAALLGCMKPGAKKICNNLVALEAKAEKVGRTGETPEAWAAHCTTAVEALKGADKTYYECLQKCSTSSSELADFERCDEACPAADETERLSETAVTSELQRQLRAKIDALTPATVKANLASGLGADGYDLMSEKEEVVGWRGGVMVGRKNDTSRPMTAATVLLMDATSRKDALSVLGRLESGASAAKSGSAGSKKVLFVRCDLERRIGASSASACSYTNSEISRIMQKAAGW